MTTSTKCVEAVDGPLRGRPRDETKAKAILHAATDLFLEKGFEGTSMEEVARAAGVSKQTVYSHFAAKEQLFTAAVRTRIQDHYPNQVLSGLGSHTLESDLRVVSRTYARLLLSDDAMSVFRLLVAAAPQNTAMAQLFWQSGPLDMMRALGDFLMDWHRKGALVIDEPARAAEQLIALLRGEVYFLKAVGLIDVITDEMITAQADAAVEAFLKIYQPI